MAFCDVTFARQVKHSYMYSIHVGGARRKLDPCIWCFRVSVYYTSLQAVLRIVRVSIHVYILHVCMRNNRSVYLFRFKA